MTDLSIFNRLSIEKLYNQGCPEICIAILDGLVDMSHSCFQDANLTRLSTLVQGKSSNQGSMSTHGTHVTSVIFGQPGSSVEGIAPRCKGLIVPIFSDDRLKVSQLDLARAIEQAVNAGANVINISGGQLTDFGEAEAWLENAVNLCKANNVLIVAAAGNDGCNCLHVPASLPTVLAVGAMDTKGKPLDFSNWGEAYQAQGLLAPGENILGAQPGGGTISLSGTSFATPIVSGIAALLLSLQIKRGEAPDPHKIRKLLLQSALPCEPDLPEIAQRCLAGKLNISGALTLLIGANMSEELALAGYVEAAGCGCRATPEKSTKAETGQDKLPSATEDANAGDGINPSTVDGSRTLSVTADSSAVPVFNSPRIAGSGNGQNQQNYIRSSIMSNQSSIMPNQTSNFITASQAPNELATAGQLVYALGVLGYDFGSEARRDSFKQLMPPASFAGTMVPSNPFDARQMVDYLAGNLSEARSLIWTLNIELTPVYAIEPKGPFAREIYQVLQELLSGQIQAEDNEEYVERISVPGLLTGRTVKLFSGQEVPVIEPQNTRGLYGWKVNTLVTQALRTVTAETEASDEDNVRRTLESFLNRVYYDLRNLGTTSQDRALNFAVTNVFQAAYIVRNAIAEEMELDSITVEKSPFCRLDSDCWDVKLKFFDPENSRRAKKVYRFTIDVSDLLPITLGEPRSWSSPY
ncbi:S8 family peptidase [Anabaena azotica]|uniref:PatA/PatG family cyanobactin maturation protease n=1 Tax=Anabaena azotica FACHB-119 TaxID=947527 RepID=A0ABR8DC47_9NOST|nr:PatA/PatG family cyanobactin maturation protease [Anabaena azotica]MBD2504684.1 PatA/PatG family cyanobactin maturation protease [Anabaena azotica FACHB-119]